LQLTHFIVPIPSTIGQLSQLTTLQISSTDETPLPCTIPSQIGMLTQLNRLYLEMNYCSGTVPSSIGQLSALTMLGLVSMPLCGSLPTQVTRLSRLLHLSIDAPLEGPFPTALLGFSALTLLSVSNAFDEGSLPTDVGRLSNLQRLIVVSNSLSGSLPTSLWTLTALTELRIEMRAVSGTISGRIGDLTNLNTLSLSNCRHLSGTIPSSIARLPMLTSLTIAHNNVSGTLPTEFVLLSQLIMLDLTGNRLAGDVLSVPGSVSNCMVLGEMVVEGRNTAFVDSNCISSCSGPAAVRCCAFGRGDAVTVCTPINDDCFEPTQILDNSAHVTNENATTRACYLRETCPFERDVWFLWRARCSGTASFVIPNATQIELAVYSNDWFLFGPRFSGAVHCSATQQRADGGGVELSASVQLGAQYYVQVGVSANVSLDVLIDATMRVECLANMSLPQRVCQVRLATTTTPSTREMQTSGVVDQTNTNSISQSSVGVSSMMSTSTGHDVAGRNVITTQVIVGIACGVIAVLGTFAAVVLLLYQCRRRRARRPLADFEEIASKIDVMLDADDDSVIRLAELRNDCLDYTRALGALHESLSAVPRAERAPLIQQAMIRERNQRALMFFRRVVLRARDELSAEIEFLAGHGFRFDVFIAHDGKLKESYVGVTLREALTLADLKAFIDDEAIRSFHGSKEIALDVGLLTSRVALFVMSEGFVAKKWPLYELFFFLARGHDASASFVIDLFNEQEHRDEWIEDVSMLALPWPHDTDLPRPSSTTTAMLARIATQ
jgi:hypothetical protein